MIRKKAEIQKIVLYTVIAGWFGSGIWIGEPYIGSFWGNIIFISAGLFLFAFSILNLFKIKEIEEKKVKLSRIKNTGALLVVYFLVFVTLYIVRSFTPPSSFLISLFFIYLTLTVTWIVVFENRMFTGHSFLLLLLALFPLFTGLMLTGEEQIIKNSIEALDAQVAYYEDNLDDIANGILTRDLEDNIKFRIQNLKSYLEDANREYLSGDLGSSRKNIEKADNLNTQLKKDFRLLNPKEALFDMLRDVNSTIARVSSEAQYVQINSNGRKSELDQIMLDINLTKTTLDDARIRYLNGDFQISYNLIKDIDKEIMDIEQRIDRCRIISIPRKENDIPLIVVLIIIVILSMFHRRHRKKQDDIK